MDDKKLTREVRKGRYGRVQSLLSQGADVNAKGGEPLLEAIKGGNVDILRLLLTKGADEFSLREALIAAVTARNARMVRILLDNGADPNARGGRPLNIAATNGDLEIVHILLDNGADEGIQEGNALTAAAKSGSIEIAELLMPEKEAGDDFYWVFLEDAVVTAVENGDLRMVRFLLSHDANPNAGRGEALVKAAESGDARMVHLLLANGADPNTDYIVTWEYGGETVYYPLSSAKNLRVASLLLSYGADPSLEKAIVNAVATGSLPMVKLLIEKRADLSLGEAFQGVVGYNYPHMALYLISKGVDPLKWVDKYSQSALFLGSDTYLVLLDMYPDLYSLPVRSYSLQEAINRQRDTTNAMKNLLAEEGVLSKLISIYL